MESLDLYDLTDEWMEFNDCKTAYSFAEEEFDKVNFTQLVKQTFQAIKQIKNNFMNIENHIADIKNDWSSFSNLLINLALYSADTSSMDESEDCIFSASQAIVRLLLGYATTPFNISPTDDTGELFGTCEDCGLFCPCEEEVDSEYWMQNFTYDVNSGDMTEIINLAERSAR